MATIQIRGVPPALHRRLKVRAASEQMSMSALALRELERALEVPTRRELLARLKAGPKRALQPSPTEIVRAQRDASE